MSNPPEEYNRWASSATAYKPEPGSARKDTGWLNNGVDFAKPGWTNWLLNNIYTWLVNIGGSSAHYDTPEDAVDGVAGTTRALTAGETCIIDEIDTDQIPGQLNTSVSPGAVGAAHVDVTGNAVVVALAGIVNTGYAYSRDLTTLLATYTPTVAGFISKIISDGVSVVIVTTVGDVELFDFATGVSQWTYSHGGAVHDVCMDGTNVYIVGAESVAGPADSTHFRALTIAAGVATWSRPHDAPAAGTILYSCCVGGGRLFVAGDAAVGGAFPTGATIRSIRASNGADATGECGLADTNNALSWDAVQITPCDRANQLASDGRRLYVGYPNGGATALDIWDMSFGIPMVTRTFAGPNMESLSVDDCHLIVTTEVGGVGSVHAFDKQTLSLAWTWYPLTGAGANMSAWASASDGSAVFVATDTGGAANQLVRLYRGSRPKVWRRATMTDDHLPYRQMIFPEE